MMRNKVTVDGFLTKFMYICPINRINTTTIMNTKNRIRYLIPAGACFLTIIVLTYYYFFSAFSASTTTQYILVDTDDTADSLYAKMQPFASRHGLHAFHTLAQHTAYENNIQTGRYEVQPGMSTFQLYRKMKGGLQTPLNLTIPSVRTITALSEELGRKLMVDAHEWEEALQNPDTCAHYGYTPETIVCLFIPNTYAIYWNTSVSRLFNRMQKESKTFWNDTRLAKAKQLNLSPEEVITLASIVDEETANNSEKPMIAGMYYNRLNFRDAEYPKGMPLQADPTIKFALGDFSLKRIYHNMLKTDSPYNTYTHAGLPPGPIRIPSVAGIDAVLNLVHHNYLYMCAKEDFSGTHNFAATYKEHLANAARYSKALNSRGIK